MSARIHIDYSEVARRLLSAHRPRFIRPAKRLNLYIAGLFIITDNSSGRFSAIPPPSPGVQNNGDVGSASAAQSSAARVDSRHRAFD